jgi:hypothetical protein
MSLRETNRVLQDRWPTERDAIYGNVAGEVSSLLAHLRSLQPHQITV